MPKRMSKKEADEKFYQDRVNQTTRQLVRYTRTFLGAHCTEGIAIEHIREKLAKMLVEKPSQKSKEDTNKIG